MQQLTGAASDFWTVDPIAFTPQLTQLGTDATPFWTTAAFVGSSTPCSASQSRRLSGTSKSTEPSV